MEFGPVSSITAGNANITAAELLDAPDK